MTLNVFTRFYKNQDNLFTFNLKYLSIVGLWPTEDMSPTKKILYKLYETTISLFTIILLIITGIGTYRSKNDIPIFLANLDKILVGYNFFSKTIIFINKKHEIRSLIERIENSGDKVSEEQKELMAKYVISISILSTSIITAFTGLALFEGRMTIDAWMPFDPMESQINLIIANQILAILFIPCTLRAYAMKGLVCSVVMYLCDQLVMMQEDIKMLKYSEESDVEMRRKLKGILKKHIRLMSYSISMEVIFREYFLIQNLAVSVELCLNAVLMTVAGVQQISMLITLLGFLFCAILNAYIYCYLGNELIIKSEGIAMAAYESTWTSWPEDLQKNIVVLITAAQRPFKLSAGGITLLCLETFSQTLYNGYSIFAVLNDMVEQ